MSAKLKLALRRVESLSSALTVLTKRVADIQQLLSNEIASASAVGNATAKGSKPVASKPTSQKPAAKAAPTKPAASQAKAKPVEVSSKKKLKAGQSKSK